MLFHNNRKRLFPEEGTALVIGGTGGIGKEVSLLLAESGSNVTLTYQSNETTAKEISQSIESIGRQGEYLQMTLENLESVEEKVRTIKERFGSIHTIIYAAGPKFDMKYVSNISPSEWYRVIESDINGFYNLIHSTLPILREQGGGSYVSVVTTAVTRYSPRDALSAVPKASVQLLTRAIAREEGRFGIRANCMAPGVIEAGLGKRALLSESTPQAIETMKADIPLKRFGKPEEAAAAVVFLASSQASFITGQIIAVDGGWQV